MGESTLKNDKSIWVKLKRMTRLYYLRVMRTKAPPRTVAIGVACGVFGGCFPAIPPLPIQTLIALCMAFIFRGSKIPAVLATYVSNPLNWPFFWWAQYRIGEFFMPIGVNMDLAEFEMADFFTLGWRGVTILMTGGLVLAIPIGLATYFIVLPLIKRYRERKALRLLKKKTRL
jgi:uncharacterized protein (DUF2062 family)